MTSPEIEYRVNPPLDTAELDRLYAAAWPGHQSPRDFRAELDQLLAVVGAYASGELVGCVKLAWDGARHAFLLEPTVHPSLRHRGIGRALVQQVVHVARQHGLEWVHVDYEPHLTDFYQACGFQPTAAGLIRLDRWTPAPERQALALRRAIVIFPSLGDLEPILPFRRRWDPLADRIPPHLTLVFPFVDPISTARLQGHVADAIRGIAPFFVRLSGVSGSEGEYLLVNVKQGNDLIVALHDRLYTGPLRPYLSLTHTFVPHLTIGRVADRHGFEAALAETAALSLAMETLVRAVTIYAIDPSGSRHVETEIRLQA